MNVENLKKVINSKDDLKAFLTSQTREDALKCLNDNGVDVKDEELEVVLLAIDKLATENRMDLDDMDAIAGGKDVIVDVNNIISGGFQIYTIPYTAPIQFGAVVIKEGITMAENIYASLKGDINKEQMDKSIEETKQWKEEFDAWLAKHPEARK